MSVFRRKPLWYLQREAKSQKLVRHFDLCSLLAIGIGGTVGSGIFVLSGRVAAQMAGPATCLSWLIAGLACLVTCLAYAELSGVIPASGSTYTFSYHGLGEIFAMVGAWFLTLEYALSSAAVARAWGDKLAFWLAELNILGCKTSIAPNGSHGMVKCWVNSLGHSTINLAAGGLSLVCMLILLHGIHLGRKTVNVMVALKVSLVLFVIICGSFYVDNANLRPFIPPRSSGNGTNEDVPDVVGGISGILMGATVAFFGFIGFDEVACLSGEAISPRRDVPLAVIGTIVTITVLYVAASVILVAMVPYDQISPEEGFGSGFRHVGADWAMHILMFGQVAIVLPVVVLVSLLPQSRLQYAMAKDGMLPSIFARIDKNGNLWHGTLLSGIAAMVVSICVPFDDLNDLISGGILLSFVLTNSSLLMVRARHATGVEESLSDSKYSEDATGSDITMGLEEDFPSKEPILSPRKSSEETESKSTAATSPPQQPPVSSDQASQELFAYKLFNKRSVCLFLFSLFCMISSLVWVKASQGFVAIALAALGWICLLGAFGHLLSAPFTDAQNLQSFAVPLVPVIPGIAIHCNWYLFSQLSRSGIIKVFVLVALSLISYFFFGYKHSVGRKTNNWTSHDVLDAGEREDGEGSKEGCMTRTLRMVSLDTGSDDTTQSKFITEKRNSEDGEHLALKLGDPDLSLSSKQEPNKLTLDHA